MRVGAQTGMGYPFRRFLAAVGENNPRFRAVSSERSVIFAAGLVLSFPGVEEG